MITQDEKAAIANEFGAAQINGQPTISQINVLAFNMANYLRAYLSGMAIVPVEPTLEMINAALPHAMRESDEEKYRAIGEIICIWDEMLAAAKEKGE